MPNINVNNNRVTTFCSFSLSYFAGITKRLPRLVFMLLVALLYRQLQASPPKIPGTPGGPPVTSPRIQLKDGRHLAYYESGVPKDQAKYKIIFVHGFDSSKLDVLRVSSVSCMTRYIRSSIKAGVALSTEFNDVTRV
jgi:hypothetical protein